MRSRLSKVALALVAAVLIGADATCAGTGDKGMGQVGAITSIAAREKATTAGTATFQLGGGTPGAPFTRLVTSANRLYGGVSTWKVSYLAQNGSEQEWGIGTLTNANPDTLSRDHVKGGSGFGSLVNFSSPPEIILFLPPDAYNFRGALVRLDATKSIAHATPEKISWDSAEYDTDGIWSAGSATLIQPPDDAQLLRFYGQVDWEANSTGTRIVSIEPSAGSMAGFPVSREPGAGPEGNRQNVAGPTVKHVAGRTYSLEVIQTSGGSLNVFGNDLTWLAVEIVQ